MYDAHVPVIADYVMRNPEGLYRAALFAILSIRRPVTGVPDALDSVLSMDDASAGHLYGWKRQSYDFLTTNKIALHSAVTRCNTNEDAIFALASCPGLGIIKAAFVAQLAGFDVACLDSNNMGAMGRHTAEYKTRGPAGKREPKFRHDVARYVAETHGRSREFWNIWCSAAGKAYGVTGEHISRLHLDTIVPYDARRHPHACAPCPCKDVKEETPW